MSSIKVIIQYNGKELTLDIEINEDNIYNTFLDIFRQKFREEDINKKYKLTAINTSIPYLIIDENNISNIFKEKIENDAPLKILITNEEDDEGRKDSKDDKFFRVFIKGAQEDEDDFDDNDFVILDNDGNFQKDENEMNNKDELSKEENDKKEKEINKLLNDSLNKVQKDNEIELNKNIIEIKKKKEEVDIDNNLLLSNIEKKEQKSIEEKQNPTNIKKESLLPVIPLNIPDNIFSSEVCTFCFNIMTSSKYICSICENCNLCEKCESIHLHPCFKYKTQFLSNLTDTYKYIDRNYNYHIPLDSKKMTKLIRKEYDLKILPMTDLKFTLRPNKIYEMPVKVLNLSDTDINSSKFMVVVKNNKLINISYEIDKIFVIKPNEEYELKLICRTPNTNTFEQVNIEIYSDELKIRMSSRLNFDLEIEVNKDEKDEKLNEELNNDKYAIFQGKVHKKVILSMIYFNGEWKNELKKVCQVLRDNNWDTNKSIHILNKKK